MGDAWDDVERSHPDSLSAVMFMPRKNVATVLPDSIAAVAVPPTHTTSTAQSLMPMI